jgi:XTP/dITP diphosphohydrolase
MRLLIATTNPGKVREYADIYADLPLEIVGLREVGLDLMAVDEPYETFEANAVHKAQAYARASGLLTLADDSGLEVDALDGKPGVHTARYGGPGASDRDRYMKLLSALGGVPDAQRTARFVCVIAVADPISDRLWTARGEVQGRIAQEPGAGLHGFGFDPVFIPDGYAVTFSALTPDEKHRISHRGRAAQQMRRDVLEKLPRDDI